VHNREGRRWTRGISISANKDQGQIRGNSSNQNLKVARLISTPKKQLGIRGLWMLARNLGLSKGVVAEE
jgi:hypothetical protein